jgi:hypothetical protein
MDPLILDIKCRSDKNREKFKFVDDLFYFEELLYILEGPVCLWVLQGYKLVMIFQLLNIFGSTNHWNSFLENFGGPKYGRPSKNLCYLVILAPG